MSEEQKRVEKYPQPESGSIPDLGMPIFWAVAFFAVFWALGAAGLAGSEGRWAEIPREMLLKGDYFHPTINWVSYADKPLLTYWFILLVNLFAGVLGEWTVRAPSAIAGLIGIWATMRLGRHLWSEQVARMAGWMMISTYGVLFWSRTAAADMANMTAIILAVTWFWLRHEKPGFLTYAPFYIICGLGAHAKGLPALGLPVVLILPFVLREGRWKNHLRVSHVLAGILGLMVYAAPFVCASMTRDAAVPPAVTAASSVAQDAGFAARAKAKFAELFKEPEGERKSSGVYMAFRENVVRFFNAYDHKKDGYFAYFYFLPQLIAPWSLLLVASLVGIIPAYRKLDPRTRWLLEACAIVFLVFTISQSRRVYYILPIIPFCALLMAVYLSGPWQKSVRDWTVRIMTWVFALGAGLEILLSLSWLLIRAVRPELLIRLSEKAGLGGVQPPLSLLVASLLLGCLAFALFILSRRESFSRLFRVQPQAASMLALVSAVMIGVFALQIPLLDVFRTQRPFAKQLGFLVRELQMPPEKVAFFLKGSTDFVYYMRLNAPVTVLGEDADDDDDSKDRKKAKAGKKIDALAQAVEKATAFLAAPGDKIILSQERYMEKLLPLLPETMRERPFKIEPRFEWEEKRLEKSKKMRVWIILDDNNKPGDAAKPAVVPEK